MPSLKQPEGQGSSSLKAETESGPAADIIADWLDTIEVPGGESRLIHVSPILLTMTPEARGALAEYIGNVQSRFENSIEPAPFETGLTYDPAQRAETPGFPALKSDGIADAATFQPDGSSSSSMGGGVAV
eukprot:CAMPEP_0185753888 /NCGR_PEP_ID=MMETSP1174-20130828/12590_1 /TAXON_ID=35687 /ORGANISM="Dictyocha speculum, Strain CCMP1381" /LENGTH=129 /DNA_ID=CAMNT_0028431913 /DNA_START=60 /DNA_END=445 /DNA_ORIENTATION=+